MELNKDDLIDNIRACDQVLLMTIDPTTRHANFQGINLTREDVIIILTNVLAELKEQCGNVLPRG